MGKENLVLVIKHTKPALDAARGSGDYVNCSKPGYDHWSSPDQLPGPYCRFYSGSNLHFDRGWCGVKLAEEYQKLASEGGVDLEQKDLDPKSYYSVDTTVGDYMITDLQEMMEKEKYMNPEECVKCIQGLRHNEAVSIVGGVIESLRLAKTD